MNYIVTKRFKTQALTDFVNLPYGTEVQCVIGYLVYGNQPLCKATSQNAYDYFARNDDGKGLERGNLTQAIQKILSKRNESYQDRWDKVWEDELCQKYKRAEYADFWLWNHDFYNAPIEDLQYIASLVGARL